MADIYCSSNFGNAVEVDKKPLHLVPASPEEIANLRKSRPQMSSGPFRGGNSAYDGVEIYRIETKNNDNAFAEATVSIYARASKNEKEFWFKLIQDRGQQTGFDFFNLTPGDAGVDSGAPPADASGESAADQQQAQAPHSVRLAVKGHHIPILTSTWNEHSTGASTFAEIAKAVLLDFRRSPPSVMAAFQCVAAEGGGVCGVWDNGSAPATTVACNWDDTKADFLCTSTAAGDYTVRVSRRYYLASGADAPYTAANGDPPDLSAFAAWVTHDANFASRKPDIPGLGPTTVLARYSAPDLRETAILFASRGRTSNEPRFFAVIVDPQGSTQALEIIPQPPIDEPAPLSTTEVTSTPDLHGSVIPSVINPAERFADDAQPSFLVETLEALPKVNAWRVAVKQGNAHEVLWLGAGENPSGARYVFSAVRLATEQQDYASCGSTRSKPFAAAIKRQPGSLDAVLDVEAAHQFNVEGNLEDAAGPGDSAAACPRQVKITWNPGLGFVREETDPDCPATTLPRSLSISDAGVISIVAATPSNKP